MNFGSNSSNFLNYLSFSLFFFFLLRKPHKFCSYILCWKVIVKEVHTILEIRINVSEQNFNFWLRAWLLLSNIYIRNINTLPLSACILRLVSPLKQSLRMISWKGVLLRKFFLGEEWQKDLCMVVKQCSCFSSSRNYMLNMGFEREKKKIKSLFPITLGLYNNKKLWIHTISVLNISITTNFWHCAKILETKPYSW